MCPSNKSRITKTGAGWNRHPFVGPLATYLFKWLVMKKFSFTQHLFPLKLLASLTCTCWNLASRRFWHDLQKVALWAQKTCLVEYSEPLPFRRDLRLASNRLKKATRKLPSWVLWAASLSTRHVLSVWLFEIKWRNCLVGCCKPHLR